MHFDEQASNYNSILNGAISFSGYGWEYFARYKAKYVANAVSQPFNGKILDFGCGVGNLVGLMKEFLPQARIDGYDVSTESLKKVSPSHLAQGTFTDDFNKLATDYDLVVVANVFHHVELADRQSTVNSLAARLKPTGRLIIFEHNPLNPGTQLSVKFSPIDRGAIMVSSGRMIRYLEGAGFRQVKRSFIVFFPKITSFLQPLEPYLGWLPMGAQYALVAGPRP